MNGTNQLTTDGLEKNPIMDMFHELSHGFDADNGWMDNRDENGLSRNEWQANSRENYTRKELGFKYRILHGGGVFPNGEIDPSQKGVIIILNDKPVELTW